MAHTYIPTAVILVGVVLAVAFGPHTDLHLSSTDLLARFTTPAFIGYACTVVAVSVALWLSIAHVEARFKLPDEPLLADYVEPAPATTAPATGSAPSQQQPVAVVVAKREDKPASGGPDATASPHSSSSSSGSATMHRLGWARYHRIAYALLAAVVGAQVRFRWGGGVLGAHGPAASITVREPRRDTTTRSLVPLPSPRTLATATWRHRT